jgi:hypothetical protein
MSYAGPASRTSRDPETEPLGSSETPRRSAVSALVPVREKPGFGGNRETIAVFAAGVAMRGMISVTSFGGRRAAASAR